MCFHCMHKCYLLQRNLVACAKRMSTRTRVRERKIRNHEKKRKSYMFRNLNLVKRTGRHHADYVDSQTHISYCLTIAQSRFRRKARIRNCFFSLSTENSTLISKFRRFAFFAAPRILSLTLSLVVCSLCSAHFSHRDAERLFLNMWTMNLGMQQNFHCSATKWSITDLMSKNERKKYNKKRKKMGTKWVKHKKKAKTTANSNPREETA